MARHRLSTHATYPSRARPLPVSPERRRPVWQHVILSCLLALLLLTGTLSQWSLLVPHAHAAASTPVRSSPPSLTFAKYLKESSSPQKPHQGPPSPYPQPTKHTQGKPIAPPPAAEPATMQPINAPLSAAFLAGGPGTSPLDLHGSDGRLALVWVKPVINTVNFVRGVMNFFDPLAGVLKTVLESFVTDAKEQLEEAAGLFVSSLGSGILAAGGSLTSSIPSATTILQYSNAEAYSQCIKIYSPGECQ
jgi:hypothetical protein